MTSLLLLMLGLVGQWMLGIAAAQLLLTCRRRSSNQNETEIPFVELAGLGFVLGIGLTASCLFAWSFCGGMLGRGISLALAGIGIVCGAPVLAEHIRFRRMRPSAIIAFTAEQQQERAFCRLCQCVIALLLVSALVQSLLTPQCFWDERAIFAVKATVLFEDQGIRSSDLFEKDFVQGHPRYPLLLPLTEQHVYALLGDVDDRLSKLIFPLFYAGLVLNTVGVLSRNFSLGWAWLTGVLLATVPALMPHDYGFLCAQADAPVACFHGVAILYLWEAIERMGSSKPGGRNWIGPVIVAGLCSGLSAFTKDEGIAFLIINVSTLTAFSIIAICRAAMARQTPVASDARRTPPRLAIIPHLMATIVFVASSAVVLIPWFVHRHGLPLTTEMNYVGRMSLSLLANRLSTLTWSLPHLAWRMFGEWSEWGLHWWLMLVALAIAPRRLIRPAQILLLLDMTGAILALLVAGMLAPIRLEEHIGGSSHRFLMQITPVAVLFIATQLAPRRHHDDSLADSPEEINRP